MNLNVIKAHLKIHLVSTMIFIYLFIYLFVCLFIYFFVIKVLFCFSLRTFVILLSLVFGFMERFVLSVAKALHIYHLKYLLL